MCSDIQVRQCMLLLTSGAQDLSTGTDCSGEALVNRVYAASSVSRCGTPSPEGVLTIHGVKRNVALPAG